MRIAFHLRSVLAPMLGVLLTAPSPAEANEGVAFFSDPSQIAGSAAPSPRSSTLGEESHLVARNSTSYYPKAALKVTDVAYMRQLPAEGVLSVNPSNMLALHGSGAKEAADVLKKSNGPLIELPGHHRHKGILERSASSARARRRCQSPKVRGRDGCKGDGGRKADGHDQGAQAHPVRAVDTWQQDPCRGQRHGRRRHHQAVNTGKGFSGYKQMSDEAIGTAKADVILPMKNARLGRASLTQSAPQSTELFAGPFLACDLYEGPEALQGRQRPPIRR
ncbi:hemin ABC transporter substrate-binding protein [Mesorhizobium shangrilense]|uniref:Hemin ABC transporter substrate-binding protein n=1 Tax=Mesorhizobium shangrilense TaxID=460060 RepID=A0ABV2DLZ8_9HYPH